MKALDLSSIRSQDEGLLKHDDIKFEQKEEHSTEQVVSEMPDFSESMLSKRSMDGADEVRDLLFKEGGITKVPSKVDYTKFAIQKKF